MARSLCIFSAIGGGIALVAVNGRVGGVDLTQLPPALMAFVAVSALILVCLHLI